MRSNALKIVTYKLMIYKLYMSHRTKILCLKERSPQKNKTLKLEI